MATKCFLIEPTDRRRQALRRFTYSNEAKCPSNPGGHDAETPIEDGPVRLNADGLEPEPPAPDHFDPRWPTHCSCGYAFQESDQWQLFTKRIYRRSDTGEETTLWDCQPGAMWWAPWMASYAKGPDGRCLVVKLPNGRDWLVDSRASNCGLPNDNEHKCWVRHGEPPNVTVDKNGKTCSAGAGSIQAGDYHGFLHDGYLT